MCEKCDLMYERMANLETSLSDTSGKVVTALERIDKLGEVIDKTLEVTKSSMGLVVDHVAQLDSDKNEYINEVHEALELAAGKELPSPTLSEGTPPKVDNPEVSGVPALPRTGTVLPTEKTNKSRELATYLIDKLRELNLNVAFDIYNPDSDALSVSEFCGALGGVALRTCNIDIHLELLLDSLEHTFKVEDYASQLINAKCLDKYNLRVPVKIPDAIVFLPGSNLLNTHVDFDLINEAVNEGAKVKPHPISNNGDIRDLRKRYPGQVMTARTAGAATIPHLKRAYIPSSSELTFIAIAHDVDVVDITPANNEVSDYGCYYSYGEVLRGFPAEHRKDAMNRLFSSPYSGIFFDKESIDAHLYNYLEKLEELSDGSLYNTRIR